MKRKLVTLVVTASLALSPCVASGTQTTSGTILSLPNYDELTGAASQKLEDHLVDIGATLSIATIPNINGNLTAALDGKTITLTGILPYREVESAAGNVVKGHFMSLKLTAPSDKAATLLLRGAVSNSNTTSSDGKVGDNGGDSEEPFGGYYWKKVSVQAGKSQALTIPLDWWSGKKAIFYLDSGHTTDGNCIATGSAPHTGTVGDASSLCAHVSADASNMYTIDFGGVTVLNKATSDLVNTWWTNYKGLNANDSTSKLEQAMDDFNDLPQSVKDAIKSGPFWKDSFARDTTAGQSHTKNLRETYETISSFYSYTDHAAIARTARTALEELAKKSITSGNTAADMTELQKSYTAIMDTIYADGITDSDLDNAPYARLKTAIDDARSALSAKFRGQTTGIYKGILSVSYDPAKASSSDITLMRSIIESVKANITQPSTFGLTAARYAKFVELVEKQDLAASDLTGATLTLKDTATITYTGKAQEPGVTVKIGDRDIPTDSLTITYKNNTNAGTGMVIVKGKEGSGLTGSAALDFEIKPAAITPSLVSLTSTTATAGEGNPGVKVPAGTDYDVTYSKKVGTATATITVSGNYTGTVEKTFILKPAALKGLKATAGAKKATMSYTAQAGAKYQIVCKPASGKSKTVYTSSARKTVTGLKAGTYKIYVRAYVKVGSKTYTGSYASKTVKVK